MFCKVYDLGTITYHDALSLQERLSSLRAAGRAEDSLLLLEHMPIITLGRKATREMLRVSPIRIRELNIGIIDCDRGGNVTYHGPGQIVGYPILNFTRLMKIHQMTVDGYMARLRAILVAVLSDWGITAWQDEGGVWVSKEMKIGATGVRISSFPMMKVTKHGFALDCNTSLEHFSLIHPCGHSWAEAISMEKILRKKVDLTAVKQSIINHFSEAFGHELEMGKKEELDQ